MIIKANYLLSQLFVLLYRSTPFISFLQKIENREFYQKIFGEDEEVDAKNFHGYYEIFACKQFYNLFLSPMNTV
jgi:hypothetical protein